MTTIIDCGSNGSLAAIPALAEQFRAAFAQADDIAIDLSTLGSAELSLIQLIESARRQAAVDNRALSLVAPAPPALADILELSGTLWARDPADLQFWFHEGSH